MAKESFLPQADEPLEEYFKSGRYKKYASTISFTTIENQSEANYEFWRRLSPYQRLELHQMMLNSLYKDEINKDQESQTLKISFTEPGL